MAGAWVWAVAAAAYAAFAAWYFNWRGRVRADEIDGYVARIRAVNPHSADRTADGVLRTFLEGDDGREFFMLNLVRLAPGEVKDPKTGAMRSARAVMQDYTKAFLPALIARGGHPAMVARKAGGYVDSWGVEADPGWSVVGYMRYRSRRDMAELASDPRFGGGHEFKFAAVPVTLSFPTQPMVLALLSPKVWVALVLALLAALAQLAILALQ